MISHLLFTIHNDIYFKILRQNRIRNDREGLRRPASHAEGEEDSLAALGAEQSSCSHLRRRIATKGGAQGVVNKLRGTGWGAHVVTLWAPSSGRLTGARLSHLRCAYKCRLGTIFSRRTVIAVEGLFWSNVDDDKDEDR